MMDIISRNEAEFCGRVPLHQTNMLQPHGYLVVADTELKILQAGENLPELFNARMDKILKSSLQEYLHSKDIESIREHLSQPYQHLPLCLDVAGVSRQAMVKNIKGLVILEFEKQGDQQDPQQFTGFARDLQELVSAMESAGDFNQVCQGAIQQLKKISGFDKIMIYRFDPEWNGDVIAEVMEAGMESYLGLKFPASDIPRQAREMYRNTPYRYIPDIDYTPVKLTPVLNPVTGGFTDLTDSNLRSVAAVHLEYLQNMKIKCSMSARILREGQLWGLVACHHRLPKHISYQALALFEFFSVMLSSRLGWLETKELQENSIASNNMQASIVAALYRLDELAEGMVEQQQEVLQLLDVDGFALVNGKEITMAGNVPRRQQVEDLGIWIQSNHLSDVYHTSHLEAAFEPAQDYADTCSGLIVLPLWENDVFLLGFRPERITSVEWGGDPSSAVQFEPDGSRYHPRSSFRTWKQKVRHHSREWTGADNRRAADLTTALRNFLAFKNGLN